MQTKEMAISINLTSGPSITRFLLARTLGCAQKMLNRNKLVRTSKLHASYACWNHVCFSTPGVKDCRYFQKSRTLCTKVSRKMVWSSEKAIIADKHTSCSSDPSYDV